MLYGVQQRCSSPSSNLFPLPVLPLLIGTLYIVRPLSLAWRLGQSRETDIPHRKPLQQYNRISNRKARTVRDDWSQGKLTATYQPRIPLETGREMGPLSRWLSIYSGISFHRIPSPRCLHRQNILRMSAQAEKANRIAPRAHSQCQPS